MLRTLEDRGLRLIHRQSEQRPQIDCRSSNSPGITLSIFLLLHLILSVGLRAATPQQPPPESDSTSQRPTLQPLSVKGKLRFYLNANFGPVGLVGSAFGAALNQWRDYPAEWGQGAEGYGRRFASRLGQNTVKNSLRFVTATALHEDPRYLLSEQKGFTRRVRHAIVSVFVTRTDDGGRTAAVYEFAGAVGSEFIANQWYPRRVAATNDAVRGIAVTLGLDAARNLAAEFWPDIKQLLRRR